MSSSSEERIFVISLNVFEGTITLASFEDVISDFLKEIRYPSTATIFIEEPFISISSPVRTGFDSSRETEKIVWLIISLSSLCLTE